MLKGAQKYLKLFKSTPETTTSNQKYMNISKFTISEKKNKSVLKSTKKCKSVLKSALKYSKVLKSTQKCSKMLKSTKKSSKVLQKVIKCISMN